MSFFIRRNDRTEVRRAMVLDCQVMRASDLSCVGTRALDLSPDGMLVSTSEHVKVGEHLLVAFRATPLGIWFDAEATVARVIEGRRPSDRGRALGVRFTGLPHVKKLILRGALRRVPPPIPRRSQRIDWTATIRSIEP